MTPTSPKRLKKKKWKLIDGFSGKPTNDTKPLKLQSNSVKGGIPGKSPKRGIELNRETIAFFVAGETECEYCGIGSFDHIHQVNTLPKDYQRLKSTNPKAT